MTLLPAQTRRPMTRASLLVAALLTLGACRASIPDDTFTCVSDADCPEGFSCAGGFCRDPSVEIDAGPPDAGPPDAGSDAGPFDAGSDACGDMDDDGVCDTDDACEGFDDTLDADNDTVPDGCDICADFDDTLDADSDDVPDGCDACAGFDDTLDADNDTVPDDCDICALGDDLVDPNDNGIPEACDYCEGIDDTSLAGCFNFADNVDDESVTANHGTAQPGAEYVETPTGTGVRPGGVIVQIPDHASNDHSGPLSYEFWYQVEALPVAQAMIADDDGEWNIVLNSAGGLQLQFWNDAGTAGQASAISADGVVVPGQWYHLAFVVDGLSARLFQDGIRIARTTLTTGLSTAGSEALFVGTGSPAATIPLSGIIDGMRIWHRALDAQDRCEGTGFRWMHGVCARQRCEDASECVSGICDAGICSLDLCPAHRDDDTLRACYDFTNNAADSSGNGNLGAAPPPPGTSYQTAPFGQAIAVSSQITVANSDSLDITEGLSIETWMRSGNLRAVRILDVPGQYGLRVNANGAIHFDVYSAGSRQRLSTGDAAVTGAWQQVTATFDGTNAFIYIDGVIQNMSASFTGPIDVGDSPISVAASARGWAFDALRIWSVARSAEQVCEAAGKSFETGSCN